MNTKVAKERKGQRVYFVIFAPEFFLGGLCAKLIGVDRASLEEILADTRI
jgi:hypothetical protein